MELNQHHRPSGYVCVFKLPVSQSFPITCTIRMLCYITSLVGSGLVIYINNNPSIYINNPFERKNKR